MHCGTLLAPSESKWSYACVCLCMWGMHCWFFDCCWSLVWGAMWVPVLQHMQVLLLHWLGRTVGMCSSDLRHTCLSTLLDTVEQIPYEGPHAHLLWHPLVPARATQNTWTALLSHQGYPSAVRILKLVLTSSSAPSGFPQILESSNGYSTFSVPSSLLDTSCSVILQLYLSDNLSKCRCALCLWNGTNFASFYATILNLPEINFFFSLNLIGKGSWNLQANGFANMPLLQ